MILSAKSSIDGVHNMSSPSEPAQVKLISSLFSAEKDLLEEIINELSKIFGDIDWISPDLFFDRTRYYAKEMGWPLHRRLVSFLELLPADSLVESKIKTNGLEQQYLDDRDRRVNIDPGFISAERLVLATGKNYIHRIYLSKGIFADLTLIFQKGSFRPLKWTYPDYTEAEMIAYFNEIREKYMNQLKEVIGID